MKKDALNFSFDMTGIDRSSLLAEAADLANQRHTVMGDEPSGPQDTEEGRLIRGLQDDIAELPGYPDVYPITDESFLLSGFAEVPTHFQELAQNFSFYWIRVPVGLMPRYNWAFHRLELRLDFNKGETILRRLPKAHQILPEKKFEKLLRANAAVSVHINENLEFSAGLKKIKVESPLATVGGKVSTDAGIAVKAGLATGFEYSLKTAKIDHNSTGMEWVFWRLDGSEFFQEDAPNFVVILQVPRDVTNVYIGAELRAYRYFTYLNASLQHAIVTFPETIRNFFKGGLPVAHKLKTPWEIPVRL